MNGKQILRELLLLCALAMVAGATSNLLRPESTRLAWIGRYELPGAKQKPVSAVPPATVEETPAPASDPHAFAPPKDPGLIFLPIDGEIAGRLHKAGAVFIDARRSGAFESGHIAGARSIAVWEQNADARVAALSTGKIPVDSIIVIYCSGGDCKDSEILAQKMAMSGFFNLYIYQHGFPDWEKRGGPIRRGSTP